MQMINYGIMLVFKSFQVMHSKANANFENVFIETQKIIFDIVLVFLTL